MRQSPAGFCEEREGRFAKVSNRFQFRLLFSLKRVCIQSLILLVEIVTKCKANTA